MTKKIDEGVILNVSTTDGEVTGNTTFTANDTVELAALLKAAGVQSQMFNGPATLTVDAVQGTASIVSNITAPDLRSIMQMLEPEFQAVGDMQAQVATMEPEADDDHIVDPAPVEEPCTDCGPEVAPATDVDMGMDLEEPVTEAIDDDQYDMLDRICATVAQTQDFGSEFDDSMGLEQESQTLAWVKMTGDFDDTNGVPDDMMARLRQIAEVDDAAEIDNQGFYSNAEWAEEEGIQPVAVAFAFFAHAAQDEFEEEANYDYRTHDVHPSEYTGTADRKPVQPATKQVPARTADNPLAEGSDNTGSFRTWINTPFDMSSTDEIEVTVHYHYDSGDFDTGLDSPSVANSGSTMTIEEVLTDTGEDLLDHLSGSQLEGLEQEAIDHLNNLDESDLNELSTDTLRSYQDKAAASRDAAMSYTDDEGNIKARRDADTKTNGKRWNGMKNAQKRLGETPKSFREYVEEANSKNEPAAPVVKKQITAESLMDEFKNK